MKAVHIEKTLKVKQFINENVRKIIVLLIIGYFGKKSIIYFYNRYIYF